MDLTPVIDRLADAVPHLRSVEGAVELAAVMASRPQAAAGIAAHVVNTGLRGGAADAIAGAFTQDVEIAIAVILTISAPGDRKGARAGDQLGSITTQVINALAGWAPASSWHTEEDPEAETVGVFRLTRAAPLRVEPGIIVYAIEFAVSDQMRIHS
jgi:hypothetical protein